MNGVEDLAVVIVVVLFIEADESEAVDRGEVFGVVVVVALLLVSGFSSVGLFGRLVGIVVVFNETGGVYLFERVVFNTWFASVMFLTTVGRNVEKFNAGSGGGLASVVNASNTKTGRETFVLQRSEWQ